MYQGYSHTFSIFSYPSDSFPLSDLLVLLFALILKYVYSIFTLLAVQTTGINMSATGFYLSINVTNLNIQFLFGFIIYFYVVVI